MSVAFYPVHAAPFVPTTNWFPREDKSNLYPFLVNLFLVTRFAFASSNFVNAVQSMNSVEVEAYYTVLAAASPAVESAMVASVTVALRYSIDLVAILTALSNSAYVNVHNLPLYPVLHTHALDVQFPWPLQSLLSAEFLH